MSNKRIVLIEHEPARSEDPTIMEKELEKLEAHLLDESGDGGVEEMDT